MLDEIRKIRCDTRATLAGTGSQKKRPYKMSWYVYRLLTYEYIVVLTFRIASQLHYNKYLRPLSLLIYFCHKLIFKVDMHPAARIGKGFQLVHGFSVVIGSKVHIGENVAIFDGVSLGKKNVGQSGDMPNIGHNVIIGSGAKILGGVFIADKSIIGANTVVISSFEKEGSVIAGIPAKELSQNKIME